VIDITSEHLLRPSNAARELPPGRNGRPINVSTIFRWINPGVRGVRLEVVRIGGSVYTSREALKRFAEALTSLGAAPGNDRVGTTARAKRAERADQELRRLGI
jgi:hypothetical protein